MPVDVLHYVCRVGAEKQHRLADLLNVQSSELMDKPKCDVPTDAVRHIVLTWLKRDGQRAQLETLFQVMEEIGVLGQLEGWVDGKITLSQGTFI